LLGGYGARYGYGEAEVVYGDGGGDEERCEWERDEAE
jgi:hypothetical protein